MTCCLAVLYRYTLLEAVLKHKKGLFVLLTKKGEKKGNTENKTSLPSQGHFCQKLS